nr:hypothetical protein [Tanacetum cinerariifolium]
MRNLVSFKLLMRGNNNTITFLIEVVIYESQAMDHMITKTSTRSCDPFKHMVHYTKRKWGMTFGDNYVVTCTLDEQLCVQDKEHVNQCRLYEELHFERWDHQCGCVVHIIIEEGGAKEGL